MKGGVTDSSGHRLRLWRGWLTFAEGCGGFRRVVALDLDYSKVPALRMTSYDDASRGTYRVGGGSARGREAKWREYS